MAVSTVGLGGKAPNLYDNDNGAEPALFMQMLERYAATTKVDECRMIANMLIHPER